MKNVSDKLASLVAVGPPEQEVNLQVLPRENLDGDGLKALARDLARFATDEGSVEVLSAVGIVTLTGTLGAVKQLAGHPDIVWIDKDSEATLEDLLD